MRSKSRITLFTNSRGNSYILAFEDLVNGMFDFKLWFYMSLYEIQQRYRRSTFGPFWLTLTMGVQALVMGYLLGFLFKNDLTKFLPFVSLSLVLWTTITNSIKDGAITFIGNHGNLIQIRRPLSSYIMRTVSRNIIVFFHLVIVYFIIAFSYDIKPTILWFLSIPGLILIIINLIWITLLVAIISTRYRDIPLIIENLFNVLLWLTPVFYEPSFLSGKMEIIIKINPFTYFLEVVRNPLMNELPSTQAVVLMLSFAIVGWIFTFLIFAKTRKRIVYWL